MANVKTLHEAAMSITDGKFLCSTRQEVLDVGDRFHFSQSLKASELRAGTIIQGRITHSTSIRLSMPYKDAYGSIKGAIVLIGDPAKWAEGLRAFHRRRAAARISPNI